MSLSCGNTLQSASVWCWNQDRQWIIKRIDRQLQTLKYNIKIKIQTLTFNIALWIKTASKQTPLWTFLSGNRMAPKSVIYLKLVEAQWICIQSESKWFLMLVKIILPHFLITKMSNVWTCYPLILFENNSNLVMKRRMIPTAQNPQHIKIRKFTFFCCCSFWMQMFICICCLASYEVLLKKLHFISWHIPTQTGAAPYVSIRQDFDCHILLNI